MKKKYILSLFLFLLYACGTEDTPLAPLQPSSGWLPVVSRTDASNGTTDYLVALRYGEKVNTGILQVSGTFSSWENSRIPAWPDDASTNVDVIALHPAQETLPEELGDDNTYMMNYSQATASSKPASFEMKHLMAKLKIHILIREKADHTPSEATILLRRKGKIEYRQSTDGCSVSLNVGDYTPESVPLGEFTKLSGNEGVSTQSSDWHDDDFENSPITVVPQTVQAGTEFLTFKVEDIIYVFKPDKDLTLISGKVNILTLGILYQEPEEGESGGATTGGEIPKVQLQGITVTDWADGGTINGGEAEENIN